MTAPERKAPVEITIEPTMTMASPRAVIAVGVTPMEARALPMGSRKRVTRGRTLVSITTEQSSRPDLVVRF
jgi:hypothetical protein